MEKHKFSKEEILQAAGTDITRVMLPRLENVDEEQFIKFFKKKALELLEEKGNLFLGIGPHVEKNGEPFTEDMKIIMEFVKKQTQKKYSFRKGQLLIYLNKVNGTGIWQEDR